MPLSALVCIREEMIIKENSCMCLINQPPWRAVGVEWWELVGGFRLIGDSFRSVIPWLQAWFVRRLNVESECLTYLDHALARDMCKSRVLHEEVLIVFSSACHGHHVISLDCHVHVSQSAGRYTHIIHRQNYGSSTRLPILVQKHKYGIPRYDPSTNYATSGVHTILHMLPSCCCACCI